MILRRVLFVDWPWALSLDEDIYNARDSCTSHATENIDYLTHPLSFKLFKVKAKPYSANFYQLIRIFYPGDGKLLLVCLLLAP